MCGIFAYVTSKNHVQQLDTKYIHNTLSSRGPDSESRLNTGKDVFMFNRLSIVDTRISGMQPMTKDNVVMLCNGEIYNCKTLAKRFGIEMTSSDCSVIIPLYQKVGFEKMVQLLDGVFAIVLVDGDDIYFARDRIGVRPLFKGYDEYGNLFLSSVAKPLDRHNAHSIEQVLPGMYHCKRENLTGILRTPLPISVFKDVRDEDFLCEMLKITLIEATRKRLLSDRPIGCLLSGGLDSSIIASILVSILGSHNVRTYSIGIEGSTDLMYAKKVATYLNTDHHEVLFTEQEGLDAIKDVIWELESYDITTIRASVGMYLLGKYIKEHSHDTVIFSGEGSDELLGGYLYFHNAPNPEEFNKERLRLVDELYVYDVLRADRMISCHGLELRVPFLDRDFVDLVFSIHPSSIMPQKGYEKYILRKSFKGGMLPDDVLWRRKCAFSDGVSSRKRSWYEVIQEWVEKQPLCEEYDVKEFPSKESMYYYDMFKQMFKTYLPTIPYWLPRWVGNITDPSARVFYNGEGAEDM